MQNTLNGLDDQHVFSVTELNELVRDLLEEALPSLWLEGEISNLSQPASGHIYLTLKDEQAQIRAAMFRGNNRRLGFTPRNGVKVLVRGRLSLYTARGDYQLIIDHMEEAGLGALQRAFEQLKQRLQAEGLFAPERKRPLPAVPRHIAVITSPTGAAIRDILSVLARRCPLIPVTVLPVAVQGKEAPPQIIAALAQANRRPEFDVILLARGGGSLEDLWAFNDEGVARAIAASHLPVVSGVGHEVDFTIADFAADQRAPTPSAAAELLSPDQIDWQRRLGHLEQRLGNGMQRRLGALGQQLAQLRARLRHPGQRVREWQQRVDELEQRLGRSLGHALHLRRLRLDTMTTRLLAASPARTVPALEQRRQQLVMRLNQAMQRRLASDRQRLAVLSARAESVSPLAVLARGYAIVRTEAGEVVRRADQAGPGTRLRIRLHHGELDAAVTESRS